MDDARFRYVVGLYCAVVLFARCIYLMRWRRTLIGTRSTITPALALLSLMLGACGTPTARAPGGLLSQPSISTAERPAERTAQWNGVFSCTAHIDGKLRAITWKGIPFRQEGDRVTGLYTFTDSFNYRNSVTFSGTLAGQSARVAVTAVRANGSPNFAAEMTGSPASMAGQMMSGVSQRPVRLCTLALTPV